MNKNDLIKFEEDAREEILSGAEILYNAVSMTLGAKGRNVVIKQGDLEPFITKDGVTVARNVDVQDFMKKGAVQIIRRTAEKTNEVAGDGTTTSVVIAYNLLKESIKVLNKKWYKSRINSISFKRGIDKALERVIKKLDILKDMNFDIYDVATISANGDTEIAELIKEAFEMVGKDGIVGFEESPSNKSFIERDEGLQFDNGYVSNYFVTNPEKNTASYKKSLLVIIDAELENMSDIVYYAMAAEKKGMPLVVIAHKFGQEVINSFAKSKVERGFKGILIEAPFYGEERTQILNDIGVMTNTTVLSERMGTLTRLGLKGKNPEARVEYAYRYIGQINKIDCGKHSTSIYYNIKDDYINVLKASYKETQEEFINRRIAMLTGGVAVINVGGNSSTEVKERIDRVEDAVNAARAALNNGVVAGGGIALLKARDVILNMSFDNKAEQKGAQTLYKVLASPAQKILANAELPLVNYGKYPNWIDVSTGKQVNLLKEGIIDPVNVTIASVTNAVSVASTLSTAGAYVLITR